MKQPSRWMRRVLIAAAVHSLAWGAWALALPLSAFRLSGLPAPLYPELWQVTGLLMASLGMGYAFASVDPLRHWPVVAAGLMAKLLAPAGFVLAAMRGRLPWSLSFPMLVNDAIWWVPFALILKAAYADRIAALQRRSPEVLSLALRTPVPGRGTLEELSRTAPVLLVFLRHSGCTFCREALADIAQQRHRIEDAGAQVVLVHLDTPETGQEFFSRYGVQDLPSIGSRSGALYRAFGLQRGRLSALLAPKVWLRGFDSAIVHRHGFGRFTADPRQMPGVFVVFHGQVLHTFRHRTPADRPDYAAFVREALGETGR